MSIATIRKTSEVIVVCRGEQPVEELSDALKRMLDGDVERIDVEVLDDEARTLRSAYLLRSTSTAGAMARVRAHNAVWTVADSRSGDAERSRAAVDLLGNDLRRRSYEPVRLTLTLA